jgi:hypothetical protein
MKAITSKSLLLLSLAISLTNVAHAGECTVEGTAYIPGLDPNAASGEQGFDNGTWDNSETPTIPGSMLPGQVGDVSGSDRFYSGPATDGAVLFGPYRSFTGISVYALSSFIEFSTNWRPDGYEYCSKHKTQWNQARVCVERSWANYDTSFTVDITQNYNGVLGTPIYAKTFTNVNNFTHGKIYLPNIRCTGDVQDLEVRIHSLTGGSVDFTVHSLYMDSRWRY